MTALHTEKALEDEICRDLAAAGWLHDAGDAARYDHGVALFPENVVGWIQDTQPEAWASIEHTHGANARKVVCEQLLAFPQGALVHLALSNSAVRMTTKIAGFDTVFRKRPPTAVFPPG